MRAPVPGNLGDVVTPLILSRIFGLAPIYCPDRRFIGVGSIVHVATRNTVVWGSGLIRPDLEKLPEAEFLAVRGPLSRDCLVGLGGTVPAHFGDPAILVTRFVRPSSARGTTVGIALHYLHEKYAPDYASAFPDADLISMRVGTVEAIMDRLRRIANCEFLVTSSLHGVIFGAVFGCKVVWVRYPGDRLIGDRFKFDDFFSTIDGAAPQAIDTEPGVPVEIGILKSAVLPAVSPGLADGLIRALCDRYDISPCC